MYVRCMYKSNVYAVSLVDISQETTNILFTKVWFRPIVPLAVIYRVIRSKIYNRASSAYIIENPIYIPSLVSLALILIEI